MRQLYQVEEFTTQSVIQNINDIENQINYLTSNFNYDSKSQEFFDWILNKLCSLSKLVKRDVRFDYLHIQSKIDNLYKQDKSITGVMLVLDFKETAAPNRAYLTHTLNKK